MRLLVITIKMDCTWASWSSTDAINLTDYCLLGWQPVWMTDITASSLLSQLHRNVWHHSCTVYCWQHTVNVPFRSLNKWRHLESMDFLVCLSHFAQFIDISYSAPRPLPFDDFSHLQVQCFYKFVCKNDWKSQLVCRFFLFRTTQMF